MLQEWQQPPIQLVFQTRTRTWLFIILPTTRVVIRKASSQAINSQPVLINLRWCHQARLVACTMVVRRTGSDRFKSKVTRMLIKVVSNLRILITLLISGNYRWDLWTKRIPKGKALMAQLMEGRQGLRMLGSLLMQAMIPIITKAWWYSLAATRLRIWSLVMELFWKSIDHLSLKVMHSTRILALLVARDLLAPQEISRINFMQCMEEVWTLMITKAKEF
jgi:hypothetical protein